MFCYPLIFKWIIEIFYLYIANFFNHSLIRIFIKAQRYVLFRLDALKSPKKLISKSAPILLYLRILRQSIIFDLPKTYLTHSLPNFDEIISSQNKKSPSIPFIPHRSDSSCPMHSILYFVLCPDAPTNKYGFKNHPLGHSFRTGKDNSICWANHTWSRGLSSAQILFEVLTTKINGVLIINLTAFCLSH